tara:strand:+ start:6969 stop:7955 length:987 start_codon:yes stop_codon:yes gene_type:complete
MKHRILMTLLGAGAAFVLPALAAPDLTGKSPAFMTAYNAAYAKCVTNGKRTDTARKKPAEIAACEQSALAAASAAPKPSGTNLVDKFPSSSIGSNTVVDLRNTPMGTPDIMLNQAQMDDLVKRINPNAMVMKIPVDFKGLPTKFPDSVPEWDRPVKIMVCVWLDGRYQADDGRWVTVPSQAVSFAVELDYPADGTLQTELSIPFEAPEQAYEGLDLTLFGNSDRHRIYVQISSGFVTNNSVGGGRYSFWGAWDNANSSIRFANATAYSIGQIEKGEWVRFHRIWSGPTPAEFATSNEPCDDEANHDLTRGPEADEFGKTARTCEVVVQ